MLSAALNEEILPRRSRPSLKQLDALRHFRNIDISPSSLTFATTSDDRFALRLCKTRFDVHFMSLINAESFSRTPYSFGIHNILERNQQIFARNPYSSVFIVKAEDPDQVIGFNHVFPLTRETGDVYMQGELSDGEIRGRDIARPGDDWQHLVLFSIGLFAGFRRRCGFTSVNVMDVFMAHAKLHMLMHTNPDTIIKPVSQIEPGVKRLEDAVGIADLHSTNVLTKDHSYLYTHDWRVSDLIGV